MKHLVTALSVLLILASCQKEASLEDPNSVPGGGTGGTGGGGTGGGTTPLGLLVRSVEQSGTDSNVTVYTYDAAKRLTQIQVTSTVPQLALNYKITRNASGIITRAIATSPVLLSFGIDSVINTFSYNTSLSRYAYQLTMVEVNGTLFTDSTHYQYGASGNIVSEIVFSKEDNDPYAPTSKTDYTYTNGNVASQKDYEYDDLTSSYELTETTNFTYDAKQTPLKLGAEGIVIGLPTTVGDNNSIVQDYIDAINPSQSATYTSTLTYNTANKPSGGTTLENPGNISFNLRFYYN